MILAIDIGNSNIVIGAYEDGKLLFVSHILTAATKTEVEYAVLIRDVIRMYRYDEQALTGAILSSVVPPLSARLKKAVQMIRQVQVMNVGPGIKTGLNIRIDNPAQLGADFVATAIGAMEKYPLPAIIVDFGTATKFSVLDKDRHFIGGSIMPGVAISLEALCTHSAQLPHISLEEAVPLMGTNTESSMKSGIVLGTASMIDGMLSRYEEAIGTAATIVACGDLVETIIPHCKHHITIDETLLLDGLYAIYRRNTSERLYSAANAVEL